MVDFTSLTYASSSQLTSAKMTQLFDNTLYNREKTSFLVTTNCANFIVSSGVNNGVLVPWESVSIDTGSSFDVGSWSYVAPQDGVYFLAFKLAWDTAGGSFMPEESHVRHLIRVNGASIAEHNVYQVSSNATSQLLFEGPSAYFSTIVDASSGDLFATIVARITGSQTIQTGTENTYFMGYRIDG